MNEQQTELKKIATQLLAAMLSNPHTYAKISDEEGHGQQERILITTAIEMAEQLVSEIEDRGQ
jgi:hypothetical protein